MWPGIFSNPMGPYFQEARELAANVPQLGERGAYTADMFKEDFPQFFNSGEKCLVPEGILGTFLEQVNDSVLPSRWGTMWRYASGLYLAHFSSLYLKTYAEHSDSASRVSAKAAQMGAVKSADLGDTSISYDNTAVTAGTEKWGMWNATQYGAQLVTMARMVGMGGMWIG